MRIGAIIQARTSSTRLPEKVLKNLPYGSGIAVLRHVISRLKRSKKLSDIVIATTVKKEDDRIVKIAKRERVKYFRGSNKNVLSRYYLAAKANKLDIVVRITADCPCLDSEIIDLMIERHLKAKADYSSNTRRNPRRLTLETSFPAGLEVDVFNFSVLKEAYKNAKMQDEKEHVIPYMYRNFKTNLVKAPKKLCDSDIRITLDTEEDYALLCVVFDYLYPRNKYFNAYDLVRLFSEKPWLKWINKKVIQKKPFSDLVGELRETVRILDVQDLKRARDFIKKVCIKQRFV